MSDIQVITTQEDIIKGARETAAGEVNEELAGKNTLQILERAIELQQDFKAQLGDPLVSRPEINAADERRNVAADTLAEHLIPEQIAILDKEAAHIIDPLPIDYKVHKPEYLAELIADEVLVYPPK